jgi:predicted PurR-regulated permease PerM
LVPALAQQLYRLYLALPSVDDLRTTVAQMREAATGLPPPVQEFISTDVSPRVAASLRGSAEQLVSGLVSIAVGTILGLLNTISVLLGLLVIPTWALSVVREQRAAVQSINRLLPDWSQRDFWAVVRIVDRSFGTFVRGQLLVATVVGALTYAGLMALQRLTGEGVGYPVVLAMLAGLLQLVPQLGPILSIVLGAWAGFSVSVPTGVAVVGIYFLVQRVIAAALGSRMDRRITDLHPAILVLVIVALSQLGPLWVFLAAPVTAVARDLWRYAFGRLGDPARPAGVIPREPAPPATAYAPYRIAHDDRGVRLAPAFRHASRRAHRARPVAPPGSGLVDALPVKRE